MFKLMTLLRKKDGMSDEEFARYWFEVHAPLARRMPGLRRYVVNLVQKPPGREPEFNGVVELWFDDRESMKKAFASPEGVATQRDSEKFTSRMVTLFVEERTVT